MVDKITKLGKCEYGFNTIPIKDCICLNDSGEWGTEPLNNGVGVLRSTNFTNSGFLDLSDIAIRNIPQSKFQSIKLLENDILIEKSGGSETQPVGRVCFVNNEAEEMNLAFSNFIQRIRIKEEFDSKYIFYCLYQLNQNNSTLSFQNQTTGIRNLEYRSYLKLLLPIPSKNTQSQISEILTTVDNSILVVQKSIEKTERLRKSLMQNLLTGKLKPDGTWRNKDEFCLNKSDSISMKALQIFLNKLRPINWKFIGLKKIINLVYGSSLADYSETKGNYPVYGSNGIIGYTDNYLIKGPGIIVGRKGTIGAINWTNENFYPIDTTYYVDIIDKEINLKWVYYILNFLNLPILNSATGVPGLNKSDALSLYTIVPPIEEQLSIVSTLEQFESEIQSKENIITKLNRLKKSLLQNLLTGKVKIKPN